jgi:hypothetical protein
MRLAVRLAKVGGHELIVSDAMGSRGQLAQVSGGVGGCHIPGQLKVMASDEIWRSQPAMDWLQAGEGRRSKSATQRARYAVLGAADVDGAPMLCSSSSAAAQEQRGQREVCQAPLTTARWLRCPRC